jgi:hypothetical protein
LLKRFAKSLNLVLTMKAWHSMKCMMH